MVRLDLTGINLVRPTVSASGSGSGTDVKKEADDTIVPEVIKPRQREQEASGSKYLQRALHNRSLSFTDRLHSLKAESKQPNKEEAEQLAKAMMRGMGWREGEPCRADGPRETSIPKGLEEGVGLGAEPSINGPKFS